MKKIIIKVKLTNELASEIMDTAQNSNKPTEQLVEEILADWALRMHDLEEEHTKLNLEAIYAGI